MAYMWPTCGLHVDYMWTTRGLHVDYMLNTKGSTILEKQPNAPSLKPRHNTLQLSIRQIHKKAVSRLQLFY